jgi:DNA polymerase-1
MTAVVSYGDDLFTATLPDPLVFDQNGRVVPAHEYVEWVHAQPRKAGLACDTETAGLAWDDEVRLVQFGNSTEGFAIAVNTVAGRKLAIYTIKQYRGEIVMHNAAFDAHRLDQVGVDCLRDVWHRVSDTHVLAHILNPDRLSFKLKQLARVELGDDMTEADRQLKKHMRKQKWTYATVPLVVLAPYGVQDTIITHQLYTLYSQLLSDLEWRIFSKEMDVRRLVGRYVQWTGMRLDIPYATNLRDTWSAALDVERAYFLAEHKIDNLNANAQIADALVRLGWKPKEFTAKTGAIKLDKSVLEELVHTYPFIARLLEYKRLNKWLAAYVVNCLNEVDIHGYVHAAYNTLGAKTGRMSCSNPPLQQLPKGGGGEVRALFIASEGNVIASCDYSAIEMRLAGSMSGEPRIIEAYANGVDIYQQFADELGITRPQAKVFSLATLYGATAKRHSIVFGWPTGRARQVVRDFWGGYPILKQWNDTLIARARQGYPILSMWGRHLRPHLPYAAPNAVVQGTAAEVMKDGLLRLEGADLLRYVVAVVHDEVVLDVPTADAERVAAEVAVALQCDAFTIPLVAEASVYGRSWGAGYE